MERKEFLQSVGKGAAFALTFGCLSGCLREEIDPLAEEVAETTAEQDSITSTEPNPDPVIDSSTTPETTTPETTTPETTTPETTTPETTTPETTTPETTTPETTTPETTTPETTTPEPTPPANAVFTIDLSSSEAAQLKNNGGYIIKQNIVVAKNLSGEFVAATVVCSHDYLKKMVFKNDEFYCTEHAARFNQSGTGLNSKASRGLKIYPTQLTGNLLSVLP